MLTKELVRYNHPKNSSNSSIPIIKDENWHRRNQSLQQKTDGKVEVKKGIMGQLKMVKNT